MPHENGGVFQGSGHRQSIKPTRTLNNIDNYANRIKQRVILADLHTISDHLLTVVGIRTEYLMKSEYETHRLRAHLDHKQNRVLLA